MNCIISRVILELYFLSRHCTWHVTKVLPPSRSQAGGGVVLKSLNEKCCVERRQWAALKSLFIIRNSGTSAPGSQLSILNSKYGDKGHVCCVLQGGKSERCFVCSHNSNWIQRWGEEAGGHIFSLPFHNGETWDIMPPWMLKGRQRCPLKHTAKVVY